MMMLANDLVPEEGWEVGMGGGDGGGGAEGLRVSNWYINSSLRSENHTLVTFQS